MTSPSGPGSLATHPFPQMSLHSASGFHTFQRLAIASLAAVGGVSALAAPGAIEKEFPTANSYIHTAVTDAEGRVLLGGQFSAIGTTARTRAARFFSGTGTTDGTLDPNYIPVFSGNLALMKVQSINLQSDGGAYYTGAFTSVRGNSGALVARTGIAKLAADLTVDPFTSAVTVSALPVYSFKAQGPDYFVTTTEAGMFRLNYTGTMDTLSDAAGGFREYNFPGVWNTHQLSTGKMIISGKFAAATTTINQAYVERLNHTGTMDEVPKELPDDPVEDAFKAPKFFNVFGSPIEVYQTAFLPDGSMLVCGKFNEVEQTTMELPPAPSTGPAVPVTRRYAQKSLLRMKPNGEFDPTYRPGINGDVFCMSLQANGKVIVGGSFTQVSSTVGTVTTTRPAESVARFNADGTLDTTFTADLGTAWAYEVQTMTQQGNGKVLVTGLKRVNANLVQTFLIRLENDPPNHQLRVINSTSMQWLRNGSEPEAQSVLFEYSYDGSYWFPFGAGNGNRITGGWSITSGVPLPSSCWVRAQASVSGGEYGSSVGIASATLQYPAPAMLITRDPFLPAANQGTINFGVIAAGTTPQWNFTVRNNGNASLTGLTYEITGTDKAMFTLPTAPVAPVAAGGTTPFTLKFTPTGANDVKTATLKFFSNDPFLSTYTINLEARVGTAIEAFRYQYFGTTDNTGNSADSADPDGDGFNNLFEFIAGLVPNNRTSRFNQRVVAAGGQAKLIFGPTASGREYVVESSTTLNGAVSWGTATGTETNSGTERTFTDSAPYVPGRFYRVKITRP